MQFYPTALQKDLIRRHIGPFIFVFLTIMFLLLMQFLILYIDKLVGKGIPASIVLDLIFSNLAYMVVLAVPMAVLVSSLMAYGRFSELNELTALKAGGVSPFRMISPMILIGVLLGIGLAWFSNYVLPEANYRARALFIDIRLKKPGFDLKPNTFYKGISGYTFLVKRIDSQTDSLYDVTLFQQQNNDHNFAIIKAQKGLLKSEKDQETLTLYLYDGHLMRYLPRDYRYKRLIDKTSFGEYRISFDLSQLAFSKSNPDRYSRDDRTMSAQAMVAVIDTLKKEMASQVSVYNKFYSPNKIDWQTYKSEKKSPVTNHSQEHQKQYIDPTDTMAVLPSKFVVLNHTKNLYDEKNVSQMGIQKVRQSMINLENMNINLKWRTQRIAQYRVEVHKKIAIPFGCIIFVLIGAPLGMLTRKGNLGYAALICAITFTFYWISLIQGEKLADHMYISPFISMWFSNIVLGVLGIFLTYRVTRGKFIKRRNS